jgi:hypothetical protein
MSARIDSNPTIQPVYFRLSLRRPGKHRQRLDFLEEDGDGLLEVECVSRH